MARLASSSMGTVAIQEGTAAKTNPNVRSLLLILLKVVLQYAFMCGVLLVSAGTFRWTRAWVYCALGVFCFLVNAWVVQKKNPRLIQERHKKREDTKPFDKILTAIIALVIMAMYVVAGLDAVRYGWSLLPVSLLYLGIVLHVLGMAAMGWAMSINPYVEKTVRIQTDRDQRVVTVGPYGIVRHPMYIGMIFLGLGFPLIAGSAWSFVPLGVYIFLFILRTALEDRTLRRELPGYEEYAQRTRFRLLPGLW